MLEKIKSFYNNIFQSFKVDQVGSTFLKLESKNEPSPVTIKFVFCYTCKVKKRKILDENHM